MASIHDPQRMQLFGGKAKGGRDYVAPKPRQNALGNRIPEPEEEIALIEKEIQELKVGFEQYFLGLDRRAPTRRRDLLGERIRRAKASDVKMSTLLKHRLEQLHAKFTTFDRLWTRTIVEIEAGTYRRDLFKMKLRNGVPLAGAPKIGPGALPGVVPALSDGQIKALYDAYITARQRTNEPTDGITVQALSTSLLKQIPELMRKHECKAIDFKVVIKDSRAIIKAVPRK